MNNIQLSSRYSASSASMDDIQIIATYREGDRPLAPGAGDLRWPEIEEPGRLAAPQGEAHGVNIEGQVNPAFVAAAVAIQDELAHPPLPAGPLEVLAPAGVQRPPRCSDTVVTYGGALLALGGLTSAVVGGVLAFTSDDQQTQGDGLMAFGLGMATLTALSFGYCTGE